MDKGDPNTWTKNYVSSNRAECLSDFPPALNKDIKS